MKTTCFSWQAVAPRLDTAAAVDTMLFLAFQHMKHKEEDQRRGRSGKRKLKHVPVMQVRRRGVGVRHGTGVLHHVRGITAERSSN